VIIVEIGFNVETIRLIPAGHIKTISAACLINKTDQKPISEIFSVSIPGTVDYNNFTVVMNSDP
jgi:hypothetical protein